MLAGTGAVVDYWPVGFRHPQSFAAFEPAARDVPVPLAVPVAAAARVASTTSDRVPMPDGDRAATPGVRPAATTMAATMSYPSLPATVGAVTLGDAVDLRPLPPPVLVVARDDMSSFGSNAALRQVTAPPSAFRADHVTAYAAPADRDGDGFFAGAFKRTGTSILRTGAKTGTSLVDAVRVVGSVVRRALPNKD